MDEKIIACVVYPGTTLLDLVGPLTVLERLPPPFRSIVVGEHLAPMRSDGALIVQAQHTFADACAPTALILPGGPGCVEAMVHTALQDYVRRSTSTAVVVASICTGALVLGAAGVLAGRRATTHWAYAAELEQLGARYVRQRWVVDGKIITAAGVAAGLDMALVLATRLTDEATARRIQLAIEYDPQPPLGPIDWGSVSKDDLARQRSGGTGKQLATLGPELFAGHPHLLRLLQAKA
jgi:transcriptional regulator GlxA family with amidase domain